jgi:hypothetical protein
MENNKICIINAGRNGTTWLAMCLIHLLPDYQFLPGNEYFTHDSEDIGAIIPLPIDTPWILHCNWYPILRHIPKETLILIPYRKDTFRIICSELVAETTGEWGSYTLSQFEPFAIDPLIFEKRLIKFLEFQKFLEKELLSLSNPVVKICFDELIRAIDPRAEVVQILASHGITDVSIDNINLVNTKSPLNHADVILNYHELRQEFKDYILC